MKLMRNMKLGLVSIGVVAMLLAVGVTGCSSETPVYEGSTSVDQEVDVLESARLDVINYMEQAKLNAGTEDIEYKVQIIDEGIAICINMEQEMFLSVKSYAPDKWNRLEELYTKVSGQIKEQLDDKYGEDITVNIAIGDIDKDDYYFLATDGVEMYSALNNY